MKEGAKGIFILAPILAKKGAERVSPEEEGPNLVVAHNRARFALYTSAAYVGGSPGLPRGLTFCRV